VNVRDPNGSHEFSFRCVTNGRVCRNELPELREVRQISATWEGDILGMSQQAQTPHGNFTAEDRVSLSATGETLVFDRIVTDARGERTIRQVFRKVGPHPSQRSSAAVTVAPRVTKTCTRADAPRRVSASATCV
jgi:hypothetical protein